MRIVRTFLLCSLIIRLSSVVQDTTIILLEVVRIMAFLGSFRFTLLLMFGLKAGLFQCLQMVQCLQTCRAYKLKYLLAHRVQLKSLSCEQYACTHIIVLKLLFSSRTVRAFP